MITRQKLIDQIEKYKPYNEQEEKDKILRTDESPYGISQHIQFLVLAWRTCRW